MNRILRTPLALLAVLASCSPPAAAGRGWRTTATGAAAATTPPGPQRDHDGHRREPVTIDWWHIQNTDPGMTDWQDMADEYMAAHPNVTINITVMENEAFKAALQTNLQAGDVPDLFQSWGGGGLREQVAAGLVQDITDASRPEFIGDLNAGAVGLYNVDGEQYGIPFNLGMVGFWYNKDLFAQAGITAPPATWEEFLTDVQTLKDAGITPIAVGAGDKWPAHFYYSYLMIRIGGEGRHGPGRPRPGLERPVRSSRPASSSSELIDMEPFQAGFLAAPWDGAGRRVGDDGDRCRGDQPDGPVAPGRLRQPVWHWCPGGPIADRLPAEFGWFPFPAVEGGAGAATDGFGGGDGFAVGKDAPPEAVQFLEYITSLDQAIRTGETGTTCP